MILFYMRSSAVCVEHLVECRELKAWWCPLHILSTLVGLVFCFVLFSFVVLFVFCLWGLFMFREVKINQSFWASTELSE